MGHRAKRDRDELAIIRAFHEAGAELVCRLSEPGVPDLLMVLVETGQLFLVECKTAWASGVKLTPAQKAWHSWAKERRIPVRVCMGTHPVLEIVNSVQKTRR